MKCCKCNKEVDVKVSEVPAKWYGMYLAGDLKKMICSDCIQKLENKNWAE